MEKYFINYSYLTGKYYVCKVGHVDEFQNSLPLSEFLIKNEAINCLDELEKAEKNPTIGELDENGDMRK